MAGLGGLLFAIGLTLLITFPFSGEFELFGSSGKPLDWRLLWGGLLLVFGGPMTYGLYLRNSIMSMILVVAIVGIGGLIELFLIGPMINIFVGGSDFYSVVLVETILFSIQVIVLIQVFIGGYHRQGHWGTLIGVAIAVTVISLLLSYPLRAFLGGMTGDIWVIVIPPPIGWMSTVVLYDGLVR